MMEERRNDKLPKYLQKVLSNDDLTPEEKKGLTKPLNMSRAEKSKFIQVFANLRQSYKKETLGKQLAEIPDNKEKIRTIENILKMINTKRKLDDGTECPLIDFQGIEEYKSFARGKLNELRIIADPFYAAKQAGQIEELEQDSSQNKKKSDSVQLTKRDINKEVQAALTSIKWLSGVNPQKQKIMSENEFKRLKDYTEHLIRQEAIPDNIQPIQQTNISNEHIRYTFYLIHKDLYTTTRKRHYFIDFLHTVFAQFQHTQKDTTWRKFSNAPKSYQKDAKN